MSAEIYIAEIKKLISKLENTQMQKIHQVADLATEAFINNNLVYVFGTGHSTIMAIEVFARAGGLFHMQAIFDDGMAISAGARRQGAFERLPGYVGCIIQDYDIGTGDVVIVASNSGRNPAPVQMALEAKKLGAVVVALTSLQHSNSVPSNDPSSKKLNEIADVVIDNGCPAGDAVVELPGLPVRVGPSSTVLGAIILDSIVTQTAKNLLEKGIVPPVAMSGNLPEGKEYNKQFLGLREKFSKKLRHR
jgi:uncharacterized phosphosugar-binding protein